MWKMSVKYGILPPFEKQNNALRWLADFTDCVTDYNTAVQSQNAVSACL